MPRNYIRKTNSSYTESDVLRAVHQIPKSGSVSEACRKNGVPRTTLLNRSAKVRCNKDNRRGMTDDEEICFARNLRSQNHPEKTPLKLILEQAYLFLKKKRSLENRAVSRHWEAKNSAGVEWWASFRRRMNIANVYDQRGRCFRCKRTNEKESDDLVQCFKCKHFVCMCCLGPALLCEKCHVMN